MRNLGLYPPSRADLYGFIADGVVFPPVETVRDVRPEALRDFFSAAWAERFVTYDASYMRPSEAVGDEVRAAVLSLCDRHGPRVGAG
ncbi:hypothetical protein D3C83_26760 [compost metagenome]